MSDTINTYVNEQYGTFDYEAFCKEYKNNIKTRTFFDYIDNTFGNLDRGIVLKNLSEENILASLDVYITTGVQFQITAQNYFTYITKLFDELSFRYGIKNEIFNNKQRYKNLKNMVKIKISTLKKSNLKAIASKEEYCAMLKEVQKVTEWINKETIYDEIISRDSGVTKHYRKLISVVATRLVLEYGLKGNVLTNIDLSAYNPERNELEINGIILSLGEKYVEPMKLYLEARELVISKTGVGTEKLFVNALGKDFQALEINNKKKASNYGALFCVADDSVHSAAMEPYAYYRIITMLSKGVDVISLRKLTGFSETKILQLLEYYNDEIKRLNSAECFNSMEKLNDETMELVEGKYLRCPICHKLVSAEAKEWIVVMYEDEQEPLLSCKYCGGYYEEDYI